MLLYSQVLYQIYNYSADLFNFLVFLLGMYAVLNRSFFKDEYKYLIILIVGFVIFEVSFYAFFYSGIEDTLFINHPYAFFYLIISGIFFGKILNSRNIRLLILSTILIALIINLYQIIFVSGFTESPKILPVVNILILILSVLVHKKLSSSTKIKGLINEPLFWFNMGFLVNSLLQVFLQPIFVAVTPISDDLAFIVGTLKNLASPIMYTLWAIAVYKLTKTPFRPVASLWP